jgi:hypothetical protein
VISITYFSHRSFPFQPHPHPDPPLEGEGKIGLLTLEREGIIQLLPFQGGGWEGDGVRKGIFPEI